jgi:hypothetical protein
MMKLTNVGLIAIVLMLLALPLVAQAESLVSPTNVVLANGDTLQVQIDVAGTGTPVLTVTQTVLSADTTKYWRLVTVVNPSTTTGGNPVVTATYTPPKARNPFDVNADGAVNGRDFWSLFTYLFRR